MFENIEFIPLEKTVRSGKPMATLNPSGSIAFNACAMREFIAAKNNGSLNVPQKKYKIKNIEVMTDKGFTAVAFKPIIGLAGTNETVNDNPKRIKWCTELIQWLRIKEKVSLELHYHNGMFCANLPQRRS